MAARFCLGPQGDSPITHLFFASGPQLEMRLLFALAAVLLLCSSGWMLAVRLSSSSLRGVGWLSGFAALSAGSFALSSSYARVPLILSVVASATLLLLAHVLIEVAIIELTEGEARIPLVGGLLVTLTMLLFPYITYERNSFRVRIVVLCGALILQDTRNMVLLLRRRKKSLKPAIYFTTVVLAFWSAYNLLRIAVTLWVWRPDDPLFGSWFQNLTLLVTLTCSLGVLSGLFWFTTSQLTAKLEQMAGTDPLTRIANRRVFREWMERELLRSTRTGVPFSLLAMDLDHFKRINDSLGHQAGDEVILTAVERMQDSIRGIDVLGRWGGEEFVALLPRATVEAAALVAERIRSNIERPIYLSGGDREPVIRLTVSVGVTSYRGGEDDLDKIFYRADKALYQAKSAGRNCIRTSA